MNKSLHNWDNPSVSTYQQSIRQKIIGYDLIYDMMANIIDNFPTTHKILVVGAGGGQELLTLGKSFPSVHFTAVDTSKVMLEIAAKQIDSLPYALTIEWLERNLLSLNSKELFDVATCHLVLHFMKDLDQKRDMLQKIADSLNHNGVLFISSINTDLSSQTFKQELYYWRSSMLHNGISEDHWQRFEQSFSTTTHPITLELLINLLKEAGFTTIFPYFKTHMIDALVAIKGETTI
ncbi:class I SAM-dependent methyltransferase [Lysinibacillus macroides]|uniref:Methyltransferase type 12 n=1 Tax=Lysinibacillus macroides TaxID=33935 RepID=A0A0M9DMA5_9BACI|nr:class I SAM-dependent methyltransferase [Lysinibacillus macroides]KOY83809.1 methyltransferase type 12 [Lysinibacillus macroides]QPR67076.1 class I SAM-dependent methyltransferase [Lysinibacillus macroides]